MLSKLSISTRLWLNLLVAILFVSGLALSSWYTMSQAERSAASLVATEHTKTVQVAAFHGDFIQTVQNMNTYLLTMQPKKGKIFNQQIDEQIKNLTALIESYGAKVALNGDGYLELIEVPKPVAHIVNALFSVNEVLMNLKKSTNSFVFF